VPHFLQGGQRVASFNAIDVVSRYPTGCSYEQRRFQDAAAFFPVADNKRPLREGRLHFMRRVSPEGTVRVLNVEWTVRLARHVIFTMY